MPFQEEASKSVTVWSFHLYLQARPGEFAYISIINDLLYQSERKSSHKILQGLCVLWDGQVDLPRSWAKTHTHTHLLEASSSLEGECWWLFDMVLWLGVPKSPKITSKTHCDGFDLFINDSLQRRYVMYFLENCSSKSSPRTSISGWSRNRWAHRSRNEYICCLPSSSTL